MATVREWSPDLRPGPTPTAARKPVARRDPVGVDPPVAADPGPEAASNRARRPYSDPSAEVLPWTALSLVVALSGLFLLIAFPGNERAAASGDVLMPEQELGLVTALAELRRAVVAHRAEQGTWPGAGQAAADAGLIASTDAWRTWFEGHVASAQAQPLVVEALDPLARYLPDGAVPTNVVNGLRTVRVLRSGEGMPAEPDGSSGWILDPRNGDLRANSHGRLRDSSRALFDL